MKQSIGSEVFRLDSDIAVVTGALGRLGPVWIDALLNAGARVAALDLPGVSPTEEFHSLSEQFSADRLHRIDCDITDRSEIEAALVVVKHHLGPPTVLVNNAGIDQPPDRPGARHAVENMPVEAFRLMVDVNLVGTFLVTQVIGGEMVRRSQGSVVNIGSLYGSVTPDQRLYDHIPGEPPFLKPPSYGASKAAIINLTKYFAALWGTCGVRVNALSPGGVQAGKDPDFQRKYSDRVPLGRMAAPSDLGGPLVFLASAASAYVTGIDLKVDGGYTAW